VIPCSSREQITRPADTAALLCDDFQDRDREEFLVCLLDAALTLIGISCLSVGGLACSIVEPWQVFKTAVLANAAAIILAHNHISGNPEPSREDLRLTRQLVEAGKLMGIPVHDHLIVVGREYVSLAEQGVIARWDG